MKRTITLFLSLLLIWGASGSAYADTLTIDLETATLEELIEVRTALEASIMSHTDYKKVAVPAGTYVIGEQIPEGEYTITTDSAIAMVTVYRKGGTDALNMENMYTLTGDDSIGRIVFTEGQTVEIVGGTIFAPYAGLGF